MKSKRRAVLVGLAVVLVGMQLIPLDRSNPQVQQEIAAPSGVMDILKTSCYDCHSNQTRWPWYSYVAPVSFLVVRDVHDGRRHLNFSEWNRYDAQRQSKKIEETLEEVREGKMPMPIYLLTHRNAALTESQKQALEEWGRGAAGEPPGAPENPAPESEHREP